jgi:hypothetical protein
VILEEMKSILPPLKSILDPCSFLLAPRISHTITRNKTTQHYDDRQKPHCDTSRGLDVITILNIGVECSWHNPASTTFSCNWENHSILRKSNRVQASEKEASWQQVSYSWSFGNFIMPMN